MEPAGHDRRQAESTISSLARGHTRRTCDEAPCSQFPGAQECQSRKNRSSFWSSSRYRVTGIFRKSGLCRYGDTSEITRFRSTCLTQTSACRGSNGRRSGVDRRPFAARRWFSLARIGSGVGRRWPTVQREGEPHAQGPGVSHERRDGEVGLLAGLEAAQGRLVELRTHGELLEADRSRQTLITQDLDEGAERGRVI